MNKKSLFFGVTAVLVAFFGISVAIFQNQQMAEETAFVNQHADALERKGAPIKGPRDAKVTIVEFFDPACETCRQFAPLVKNLIKAYPGKVKVMMRYAPLHQGSDEVVKMLEAAHLQGLFWPAADLLFKRQQDWTRHHVSQPGPAKAILEALSLDKQQFDADINSPRIARIVQQDIQDGQTLKVRATPEFFVNGRPMPSFGYNQLKQLVEEEIAKVY